MCQPSVCSHVHVGLCTTPVSMARCPSLVLCELGDVCLWERAALAGSGAPGGRGGEPAVARSFHSRAGKGQHWLRGAAVTQQAGLEGEQESVCRREESIEVRGSGGGLRELAWEGTPGCQERLAVPARGWE